MDARLARELAHSAAIRHRAEEIWGLTTPAGLLRAERRARFFIEKTGMGPRHNVLEVGCGTGLFTEKMSRTGAAITATDISRDLLHQARARAIPGCVLEEADACRLAYPAATFDIVAGSSVLHHLDIEKALPELRRVLRPGGQAVFSEPNMLNPQIMLQKNIPALKRLLGDSPDETAFVRWHLARAFRRAGFAAVEIVPYDFLHPAVPGPLVPWVAAPLRALERVALLRELAGSLLIYAQVAA